MNTERTEWRPVESSFIDAIAWESLDPEEKRQDDPREAGWCLIDIRGTVYVYSAPAWAYGLLCSAAARGVSVGRVYSKVIRGHFPRAT